MTYDISSVLLYFGANSTAIRRHNGHQYFFYKVQNYTIDGRVVFNDQSVVCLWPKQDYIVFIVLLNFPVMIWSLISFFVEIYSYFLLFSSLSYIKKSILFQFRNSWLFFFTIITVTRHGWQRIDFDCKTDLSNYSLRKHPILLAVRCWGRFAKRPQRGRARRNGCFRRLIKLI